MYLYLLIRLQHTRHLHLSKRQPSQTSAHKTGRDKTDQVLQASTGLQPFGSPSFKVTPYQATGTLSVSGTEVAFSDVSGVRAVRVTLTDVSGTFYGMQIASLAEVEVIGRGE